ncbi:hypothetical protein HanRHA438_Chr10g0460331 [Helianthus annuus]|nr:hypothetical protein HanRHA438_Chr10g0460331 [Helianthus annuus]
MCIIIRVDHQVNPDYTKISNMAWRGLPSPLHAPTPWSLSEGRHSMGRCPSNGCVCEIEREKDNFVHNLQSLI